MIEIKNLTKKFGNFTAVDDISLEIKAGEIFAFLGPNGAGKTTTVKIMAGIMMPTSGSVIIDGRDISADPLQAKRAVAYIPEEPFVYPKLTGYEFLRFMGDVYGIDPVFQKKEIPRLFEMFDLSGQADELLESYSHGMRQKLLIAGIILRKPKVILFDEPTVGLDPKSVKKFKELLSDLAGEGRAVFMCTHILEMAEKLCTGAAIINEGKIIARGGIEDLKARAFKSDYAGSRSLEDAFLRLTQD